MTEDPDSRRDFEVDELGPSPTQADVLAQIAGEARLFHAPDGTAYATVPVENRRGRGVHDETHAVTSEEFSGWLVARFYRQERTTPHRAALSQVVQLCEVQARQEGPELPVYVRVGGAGDVIHLDLGDDRWRVLRLSPSSAQVRSRPAVRFRRSGKARSLPRPQRGGSIRGLKQFLNLPDEQAFVLVVAVLLAWMRPTGPYPVLVLVGGQGAAKSTTARVLKSLVDPSAAPLRGFPRSERDLMVAAHHSWVLVFDNLSQLPGWGSDALCRLSTGGGLSVRANYTDAGEVVFDAQRPVLLTGIEELTWRQDLADRAIVLHLPEIPKERRRTEAELWADFEAERPRILGALCEALRTALANLPQVQLPERPRMADFVEWVVAAEPALPWPAGSFLRAYEENRLDAVESALESDAVAAAVRELVEQRGAWEGTATQLLEALKPYVNAEVRRTNQWPGTARALRGRLNRAAPFLREAGVAVEFNRDKGRQRTRVVYLQSSKATVRTVRTVRQGVENAHVEPSCVRTVDRTVGAGADGRVDLDSDLRPQREGAREVVDL